MTRGARILFDENLGKPLVAAIAGLVRFSRDECDICHLIDFVGREGEKDEAWIPRLKADGWLVITADRGKSGGSKLPQICRKERVTHVLISGKLHNRPQFEKARAILVTWPDILNASSGTQGARFRIRLGHRLPILEKLSA